jgi:beta-lactamase regulating signal transducer with metallopeptidase domain
MIAYIVKTLLCAAVLFLIYILFLEREKMHRFNRFYLLFSIVFSFTVSFITIKSQAPIASVGEMMIPINLSNASTPTTGLQQVPTQTPTEASNLLPNLLLLVYGIVTALLLFRFVHNLSKLLSKVFNNKSIHYQGATVVLTNDHAVPHSFLNYIFIDKEKFEQGVIEKEILQHELTHVNQKHSIDILMVELLMVFAWVNPLLYLYRKAILLNHEYLADEAVVKTFNDAETYQLLLFEKVSQTNNLVLSSPFNYLITKKRLIMMTRKTSHKVAILKQIALIPLIAAIGFLFSTKVIAQDSPKQSAKQRQVEADKADAPQSVLAEYSAILTKYKIDTLTINKQYRDQQIDKANEANTYNWIRSVKLDTLTKMDKSDRNRLESLFFKMSKKQRDHQLVVFSPKPVILDKINPTKEQLKLWGNPSIYGIWINGKRAKNSILNHHSIKDFDHFELRELSEKEANNMKYKIEVALLTKDQFERVHTNIAALWSRNQYKNDMILQWIDKQRLTQVVL